MAFAVTLAARLPLAPLAGLHSRGDRIRSTLRTNRLLPPRGFRHWAPTPGVSPRRRQSATRRPGTYRGRTHTGWRTQACTRITSHRDHLPDDRCPHSGHTMDGAALPGTAEHLRDSVLEAFVCVGDNELDAAEAALDERAQDLAPERFRLCLAAVEADHLA